MIISSYDSYLIICFDVFVLRYLQTKQEKSTYPELQLFGWVDIPLGGLLGTASLDAIVTCELEVDKSTLASVVSRADLLPLVGRQSGAGGLGSKLGKVTARLTLICDSCHEKDRAYCGTSSNLNSADRVDAKQATTAENNLVGLVRGEVKESPIQGVSYNRMPKPLLTPLHNIVEDKISSEVLSSTQSADGLLTKGEKGEKDPLHAAMMFVPSEGHRNKAHDTLIYPRVTSSVQPKAVRATMGIVVKGLLGIDVGALQPNACLVEHSPYNLGDQDTPVLLSRVTVAYKPSPTEREEIHGPWILTCAAETSEHSGSYQVNNSTPQSISDGFFFRFNGITVFLLYSQH